MNSERDRLVSEHLSLVQAIAGKLKRTLGKSIDFDDLVGYGHKGLIEAADRFDSKQGVTFTTFAYYRMRGAMLDGLRTMGWYSRADYARYRAEERAQELLRNASDREAGAKEAGADTESDKAQTLDEHRRDPERHRDRPHHVDRGRLQGRRRPAAQPRQRARDRPGRGPGPAGGVRAAGEGAPADGALLLRGEEPRGGGRRAGSIQVLGQPAARARGRASCGTPWPRSCDGAALRPRRGRDRQVEVAPGPNLDSKIMITHRSTIW